jgi:DNA-binding LacI/PurR family transcriptional regulator
VTTTLRDVAKLAKVSISTASRALHGTRTRPTALETQRRVWNAALQLNYISSEHTQDISKDDTSHREEISLKNIGVVLGSVSYKFADPFWTIVQQGIDRETTRNEILLRFNMTLDDMAHPIQRQLLSLEYIDGLIIIGGHDSALALANLTNWFDNPQAMSRTVLIEGGDSRVYRNTPLKFDIITCDKRYVIYQLVEHLLKLGRRQIAFLGPAADRDERGAAFLQALFFNNLPFDPDLYVICPWSTEDSYPYAQQLMASEKPFDALICGCDAIAISAMRAARECGKRIPEDLAIAGFDDIEFAKHLHPPLTTVHVQKELLGELTVRKLIERLHQLDLPPVIQTVPSTLIARESCGESIEIAASSDSSYPYES